MKPLGIALGVDFAKFNRDMSYVASRIDAAGRRKLQIGGAVPKPGGVFGGAGGAAGAMGNFKASTDAANSSVLRLGASLLGAFGIFSLASKVAGFFTAGIKGASDLNEEINRTKVVFDASFGVIEAQVNSLNRQFGLSRKAQFELASGFGAMAQGAGIAEGASATLANQMTKLAADFSSSANLSLEEAGAKIQSGLAGESEPLRRFGVMLTEDAVKAYALSHGLAQSAGEISNQAKIMSRAALITEGLAYAQGDLERTGGDAANQFRKAGGGVEEFGIRIGQVLLPAITTGTEAFNEFLAIMLDVFEKNLPTIQAWGRTIKGVFDKVGVVIRNWKDYLEIAKLKAGEFVINTVAYIETIPKNFGIITSWIFKNWRTLLTDMLNFDKAVFTNLGKNFANLGAAIWEGLKTGEFNFKWTDLLDGFKATTEKMPELIKPSLISVDDEVNKHFADIAKREADLKKGLDGAGGKPPEKAGPLDIGKEMKGTEYKLSSAVEIGSKEASSIIARTQSQGRAGANDQLSVAKDSNSQLREIKDAVKNPKPTLQVK